MTMAIAASPLTFNPIPPSIGADSLRGTLIGQVRSELAVTVTEPVAGASPLRYVNVGTDFNAFMVQRGGNTLRAVTGLSAVAQEVRLRYEEADGTSRTAVIPSASLAVTVRQRDGLLAQLDAKIGAFSHDGILTTVEQASLQKLLDAVKPLQASLVEAIDRHEASTRPDSGISSSTPVRINPMASRILRALQGRRDVVASGLPKLAFAMDTLKDEMKTLLDKSPRPLPGFSSTSSVTDLNFALAVEGLSGALTEDQRLLKAKFHAYTSHLSAYAQNQDVLGALDVRMAKLARPDGLTGAAADGAIGPGASDGPSRSLDWPFGAPIALSGPGSVLAGLSVQDQVLTLRGYRAELIAAKSLLGAELAEELALHPNIGDPKVAPRAEFAAYAAKHAQYGRIQLALKAFDLELLRLQRQQS